jgi:hypothetical protein
VEGESLVKPEMMAAWLSRANVVLRGGGLDESPDCYKRLPQVLAAHGSTIRILHTLPRSASPLPAPTSSTPTRTEVDLQNRRAWATDQALTVLSAVP